LTTVLDDGIVVAMMEQESRMAQRWDIRAEGRAWTANEAMERYDLTPEKLEMYQGRLLWDDEQRLVLLGLLLENVGANAAVRLGDPAVWRTAVAQLT
jgi:hypothetical protein